MRAQATKGGRPQTRERKGKVWYARNVLRGGPEAPFFTYSRRTRQNVRG